MIPSQIVETSRSAVKNSIPASEVLVLVTAKFDFLATNFCNLTRRFLPNLRHCSQHFHFLILEVSKSAFK